MCETSCVKTVVVLFPVIHIAVAGKIYVLGRWEYPKENCQPYEAGHASMCMCMCCFVSPLKGFQSVRLRNPSW